MKSWVQKLYNVFMSLIQLIIRQRQGETGGIELNPPKGFNAQAGNLQVDLRWQLVENASTYTIYRGTTSNNMVALVTVSGDSSDYQDQNVSNGTTYYYAIDTVINGLRSSRSNVIHAKPNVTVTTTDFLYEDEFPIKVNLTSWNQINLGQHPYLFWRNADRNDLKAKVELEEFSYAKKYLNEVPTPWWLALKYFLYGNDNDGREAIDRALQDLSDQQTRRERGENREGWGPSDDGRRQVNIVTAAAVAYDGAYAVNTKKANLIQQVKRLHHINVHKPGYPADPEEDALSGHDVEGWFHNGALFAFAAALEEPNNAKQYADVYFNEYAPPRRNWLNGGNHPQGHYYTSIRFPHTMLIFMALHKMSGGKYVYGDYLRRIVEPHLWGLRPDGRYFYKGDTNVASSNQGEPYNHMAWIASFFNDQKAYLLLDLYKKADTSYRYQDSNLINKVGTFADFFRFLYEKPLSQRSNPININSLSLSRGFGGDDGPNAFCRTKWSSRVDINSDACITFLRGGQFYYGNHQNKDFGTFQIYRKSILAMDSGVYNGSYEGQFGNTFKMHNRIYDQQSVATNGFLFFHPDQRAPVTQYDNNGYYTPADGGFDWPWEVLKGGDERNAKLYSQLKDISKGYKIGEVIATSEGKSVITGGNHAYISMDYTRGYSGKAGTVEFPKRANKYERSMFVMNTLDDTFPQIIITYDRTIAASNKIIKTWLCHYEGGATINQGSGVFQTWAGPDRNYANQDLGGGLIGKVLSPAGYTLINRGGQHQEFMIRVREPATGDNGQVKIKNFPVAGGGDEYAWMDIKSLQSGKGRIEVERQNTTAQENFLIFMLPADKNTPVPAINKLDAGTHEGGYAVSCGALFSKSGARASTLTLTLPEDLRLWVHDLEPGTWKNGNNTLGVVNDGAYNLPINLPAGTYTISRS